MSTDINSLKSQFERLQRRVALLDEMSGLVARMVGAMDRDAVLNIAAEETRRLITTETISISQHRAGESTLYLYLLGSARPVVVEFAFEETALRFVYNSGESLNLGDISSSAYPDYQVLVQHAPPDAWARDQKLRSAIIVPLRIGETVIGTFNLLGIEAASFSDADLETAQQIALVLAVALENARTYALASDRAGFEKLMNSLTASPQNDIPALITQTMREIGVSLNARKARVRLQMPTIEGVDVAKLRRLVDSAAFASSGSRPRQEFFRKSGKVEPVPKNEGEGDKS